MVYLTYRAMSYTQPTTNLTTADPCVKIRNWRKNVAVYVLELQHLHNQMINEGVGSSITFIEDLKK